MPVHHPHDHFVREFLSEPAHARAFLRAVLPAPLIEALDWSGLRSEAATFIDENLRQQSSDLLFSVPGLTGEPQQIYLLFEHKSALDPRLAQQLLGYLARIYAAQSQPAPVVSLVFYHGDAPHPAGRRFLDELSLPPHSQTLYQPYIPDFGYVLFDLARATPHLWQSLALRLFLAALDSARDPDPARLAGVLRLADQLLRESSSTRIVHAVLVYLFQVTDLQPAQWQALLNPPFSPDLEATMISTAQQLFEQGKLEGRVEGRVEGRTEGETLFLERLLQARFGPLSTADRQRIMMASPETRLSWGERVLTAATLADVFAETH